MTEEENEAIERCNELTKDEHKEWIGMSNQEAIKIALNLIEKLQKENEELKEITKGYNSVKKDYESFGGIPIIIADEIFFNDGIFKESYINKDKIREKLNWYEDICERLSKNGIELDMYDRYQGAIELCKELLEEE